MLLMDVTLEVSKLSGWLKAAAFCRVQRRHPAEGNAYGTHRGEGTQRGGRIRSARGVRVAQLGSVGRTRRRKRTRNMAPMFVTLEVLKLSS